MREHLLESLLLAFVGGAVGLAFAWIGAEGVRAGVGYALETSGSRGLEYLDPATMTVDPVVLGAGIGIALLTGLIFGLVPAWTSSRTNPSDELRRGAGVGRPGVSDLGRTALVSFQLALTLVLLVGAGLLGTSFARLASVDTGFTHDAVLTVRYDRGPGVTEAENHGFMASVLERVGRLPGVESVSAATCPPLAGWCEIVGVMQLDDAPPNDYSDMPGALAYSVTDDYFETIGSALLDGRGFDVTDAGGEPVVVLSEYAAAEFFPGGSAIGHRISLTHALTSERMATVIGVVRDVRYGSLEDDPLPAVYLSEHQSAMGYGTLLVRTSGEPYSVLPAVRREVGALDADLPLYSVGTLAEARSAASARTRIILILFLGFAASGLLIGGVGLYGIVSHTVSRRTAEVGLRLALGADQAGVVRLVVRRPVLATAAGTVVGLVVAAGLSRYLDALLFDTATWDATVVAVAVGVLLVVTGAAAWLPARRATRIAPTIALRSD